MDIENSFANKDQTQPVRIDEEKLISIVRKEMAKNFNVNIENNDFCSPCEKRMTNAEKRRMVYFTRAVYLIFAFIWIILCVSNEFYTNIAAYVLFIPFIIFLLGFFNADCTCEEEVESDVFSVSFVSIGILVSIPLLTLFNKNEENIMLNHVIFLAMISTLLSYFHLWVNYKQRHVCKAIRSCLETFSVTLYIFAIMIFFTSSKTKISETKKEDKEKNASTGSKFVIPPELLEMSQDEILGGEEIIEEMNE